MTEPTSGHDGYRPDVVEAKWQARWRERHTNEPDLDGATRPFYNLMMFPYPSAEGLHVGNLFAFKLSSFLGRNLHFVPYSLVAVHTWLLVLEPDLAYVMCQQCTGRCPYLGNTPVSLFSDVHGDIGPKYTLDIT